MRILIFGGATEGRELSRLLADEGAAVTVSVATAYGREAQGVYPGVTVVTGRRQQGEMEALVREADLCVDATHPYAVEATRTIRAACQAAGVPCRRLLRERGQEVGPDGERAAEGGNCVAVSNAAEAAAYLEGREGRILLAIGAKELPRFSALPPARLYPRILPTHEGLAACESLGIPHRNVIAMQGPFTRELNEALIRQFQIAYLVTKDGGAAGGYPEKAQAAANTGAVLVLIRRPEETGEGMEELIRDCRRLLRDEGAQKGEGRPWK